jgi:hypothetical protein
VIRPLGAEKVQLEFQVAEVRSDQEDSEEQDVIGADVPRVRGAPREGRQAPPRVPEARRGGESEEQADRGRAEPLVVLLQEDSDARRDQDDAGVEERPELGLDGNDLAACGPLERRRLCVREDALAAQPPDRFDDVRIHARNGRVRRRGPDADCIGLAPLTLALSPAGERGHMGIERLGGLSSSSRASGTRGSSARSCPPGAARRAGRAPRRRTSARASRRTARPRSSGSSGRGRRWRCRPARP